MLTWNKQRLVHYPIYSKTGKLSEFAEVTWKSSVWCSKTMKSLFTCMAETWAQFQQWMHLHRCKANLQKTQFFLLRGATLFLQQWMHLVRCQANLGKNLTNFSFFFSPAGGWNQVEILNDFGSCKKVEKTWVSGFAVNGVVN